MSSETELAWAAGLFEGEGCIHVADRPRKWQRKRHVSLQVVSTDLDVLERMAHVFDRGTIRVVRPRGARKDTWAWQAAGAADVAYILRRIIPYLGERRLRKANEALDVLNEYLARCA